MATLLRDVRIALRLLLEEKTFSGTVLLTLAICIGANVAIFSVIRAVLLEPLPFHEPDRLVTVNNSYPGAGAARASNGSVDFFERRENVPAFQEVALYRGGGVTVGEPGSTERVTVLRVTPSFFPLLGVQPALGRAFTEEEMEEGNEQRVLLTHGYWEEQFAGAPDVVGRELRVDARPHTIVGVLGEDFPTLFGREARLVLPVAFSPEDRALDAWHSNSFQMIARLRPGATVQQAVEQNRALNDALIDRWPLPNARQILTDAGYHTTVAPTAADLVRDVQPLLYMLWAGVAFVLLIGCVNIANLMLARTQNRRTELATQLALGASRGRVARQVLTEAGVMGVIGGALGIGLGALGLRLLGTFAAEQLPRGTEIDIDGPVILFTLVLALGAGTLFASIPFVQILRGDLSSVFRSGGRTGTASRRAVLLRNALVTTQVALAFVMLIGAGLMFASFRAALSVDPGFRPGGVLTAFVSLPSARYEDETARRQLWDRLLGQVRAVPGVAAASLTTQLPFTGNNSSSVIFPEGYEISPGESLLSPLQTIAGPGYFETLGIDLVEGRAFGPQDGPEDARVIVIDEWLARRYWPDRSPVGARMVFGAIPGQDSIPEDNFYTVVGVVRTIKQNDLTAPAGEHVGAYYFDYRQLTPASVVLATRVESGEPAAVLPGVQEALGRLDPELPLFGIETMQQRIDDSLVQRRVPLILLGVFAGVALFLAMVGIYGALAYSVSQRRREIGIRMAVGSAPDQVFRSVVGQGLRITAVGLVVGVASSIFLTRLIQSLLFGVQAMDVRVIGSVALVLGAVGALACMIPARKATTVHPVEVLAGE